VKPELLGLLQLRSMYQASLPYWYFQMVWPIEQTREMASRQPNSTRIWKLVMRSTLDSFRGGRVEFWETHDKLWQKPKWGSTTKLQCSVSAQWQEEQLVHLNPCNKTNIEKEYFTVSFADFAHVLLQHSLQSTKEIFTFSLAFLNTSSDWLCPFAPSDKLYKCGFTCMSFVSCPV